jgi:hypothetical protein
MSSIDKQLIFYHLLNNHYTEVLPIADKHSHIPEFKLYRALVYVVAGQYVEAIRHLNDISRSDGDINMATLLLLIYSHKKCMVIHNKSNKSTKSQIHKKKNKNYFFFCFFSFLDKICTTTFVFLVKRSLISYYIGRPSLDKSFYVYGNRQTDTKANTIARPFTFYYYHCYYCSKKGRTG